jgi:DNA-binding transcriptional LysR family regulator
MNDLDPAWLRCFAAIADTGSMTRAAGRVFRTQSAVSTQLQQLEAALGVRLVERTTRSLSLTQEGDRFLPHARKLLELQQAAHAAVQPQQAQAVCRIGLSEYFLPARLGELLALLRDALPQARLELLCASSAGLRQLWAAQQVDLAVVTSAQPLAGAQLLRREPLAWVAGPGYTPPATLPAPLVLLGPDCPVREIALTALVRSGRPHHVQISCTGCHAAVAALRTGWGVGCLNQAAIAPDLDVLTRKNPRQWPSPGRLAFYLLARPEVKAAALALRRWAD